MTVGDATGLDGDDERVLRRFADLVEFGREAAYLTSFGSDAYREDSPQGSLLRNGGERILIKVATVVEKLPHELRDAHPGIDWRGVMRMRNLIAHHYDRVNDDLMWVALEAEIPRLIRDLGIDA